MSVQMSRTAYTNARVIDPASGVDIRGSLIIEDGRVASLEEGTNSPSGARSIDCKGRVVCPGLIDMYAFSVEPDAALRGGITTVGLLPDTANRQDDAASVEHAQRSGEDRVKRAIIGAATHGLGGCEMAEIGLMFEAGAVAFSDGRKAIANARLMRRLLQYTRHFDRPVIQHPEEPTLACNGCMNEGEVATRLGLGGIPAAAETIMVQRDITLARLTGARLHFGQISTAAAVSLIAAAKDEGLSVTCGVTPHHLMMNDTAIGDYLTFLKVSPPLRSEEDRLALVAGLADGTIDVICSANDPQDEDAKRRPFSSAADGVVGQETMLAVALSLYHGEQIGLMRILEALTVKPAEILDLKQGRLTEGAPADLIVVDLEAPWRVDVDAFASATRNSPFDTLPVQGRVWQAIVNGEQVFERSD